MKRTGYKLIVSFTAAFLLFGAVYLAFAALVEPEEYPGNPKLYDCGIRIDPPPGNGETISYPFTKVCDGTTLTGTVTVSVYETPDGQEFDWWSTIPVTRVVAKGGRGGANVYNYDSPVTSDTGLHTPVNPSGYWADLSHIDFCFKPFENGGPVMYVVSGAKFYDRDKDGEWDSDEPGLPGWKINITGDYEDTTLTGAGGLFSFELGEGAFTVSEEPPPASSNWVQTFPPGNSYAFSLPEDAPVDDLYFGNVCEITFTCGRTPGFWSNKNGKAILDANSGWVSLLAGYNLVNKNGSSFDPANYTQLRSWLLNADATNMSYMLSVQMAALILNLNYICLSGEWDDYGVVVDDTWKSINDLIDEANGLLGSYPSTLAGHAHRAHLEEYKDIFDDLNNNRMKVIPYNPCPVPVWP